MSEALQTKPPSFAVIDLGTNTFHLLIAGLNDAAGTLTEIYRSRYFIKLAENGIEVLSPAALERGMAALRDFRHQINQHNIHGERVIALGTAALRTASNGPAFQRTVREQFGFDIQIISGDREAQLIARGALLAIPPPREKVLIMDIGGGSVEFIIADRDRIYWAQSFPVGVAVLYRQFHRHEPIAKSEITQVRAFLLQQLEPLLDALKAFPATHLIGAAGTFDVVATHLSDPTPTATYAPIDLRKFDGFYRRILATTREERYQLPEIPADRADMIVVALILIDLILQLTETQELTVSYYAMKEGMMAELMEAAKSRDQ